METQIATTIEQSKRLLEAGLSPETADMCWRNIALTYDSGHAMEIATTEPILYVFNTKSRDNIPAWSLSRLIDIHGHFQIGVIDNSEELIEALVKSIIFLISYGDIREEYLAK